LRRPLIGLVVCYILGTWLGLTYPAEHPLYVLAGTALLWVVVLVSAEVRGRLSQAVTETTTGRWLGGIGRPALVLAVVLVAWSAASAFRARPFGGGLPGPEERVTITGVIYGDPSSTVTRNRRRLAYRFPVRVKSVARGGGEPRAAEGKIRIRWYAAESMRSPGYGEQWRLTGKVRKYSRPDSGGRRRFASATFLEVSDWGAVFESAGHGWPFVEMCYGARRAAAARLALGIEDRPRVVGLLHALLLGYRERLPADVRDVSAATGTLHIFAISGLHVGVMAAMIIFLLGAFRVSRVYWVLFIMPLLTLYTLATGMRPSAARACLMATVYWGAPLLGRRADGLSGLAVAALVILFVSPAQLFDVGFIYSFVVVTGLIVLYPRIHGALRGVAEPDPFRIQPENLFVRVLRFPARYVVSLAALSCAAWLSSVPLTAYCFGRFTPVALLANILVIPLTFLLVAGGCLSLVLGSFLSVFSHIFNNANFALASMLLGAMRTLDSIPCSSVEVGHPPLWVPLLWYGALGAVALLVRAKGMDFGERAC